MAAKVRSLLLKQYEKDVKRPPSGISSRLWNQWEKDSALAEAGRIGLLDVRLPIGEGKRLGDATVEDCYTMAELFADRAKNFGAKAKALKALAKTNKRATARRGRAGGNR